MSMQDDPINRVMREEGCTFPEAVRRLWDRMPAAEKLARICSPGRSHLEVTPPQSPGEFWQVYNPRTGIQHADEHLELAVAGVVDDDEFRAVHHLQVVRDPETGAFLARCFAQRLRNSQ